MQPNAILAGAAAPQFIRRYRAARVCREYREFLPHLLFGLAKEHPDNLKTSAMNGPGIRLGQLILAAHDRMKALLQITAGLLLCQFAQGGSNKPPVTRIVTRYLSPVIQPGSFGAKPKTLYIASDGYSRTEEEPDPEQGVHGLIVVSEPDVWMINLFDHTGRHIVDPGPTYIVHHNILEQEAPKEFATLEFGKEVAFFRNHKATSLPSREIDHVRCDASEFKREPYRIILYTRSDTMFGKRSARPTAGSVAFGGLQEWEA
jgi:hypothetical protein